MMRTLIVATLLFLSGCVAKDYQSDYYNIQELVLKQPLVVPSGKSYVFVKAPGVVVRKNDISTYEVYCKVAVPRSRDSDSLTIAPDVFRVNSIYRRYTSAESVANPVQVAGFGGVFSYNRAAQRDLKLVLSLTSTAQPMVKSLTCIRFSDPYFGNVPTVADMKNVMGELAEFN